MCEKYQERYEELKAELEKAEAEGNGCLVVDILEEMDMLAQWQLMNPECEEEEVNYD